MSDMTSVARRVIFRGHDGEKWIEGSLVQDGEVCCILADGVAHQVDPLSVGQWTGEVDHNGVMIFEGDLVRISLPWTATSLPMELGVHKVAFFGGAFCMVCKGRMTPIGGYAPRTVFEVVGRGYEREVQHEAD